MKQFQLWIEQVYEADFSWMVHIMSICVTFLCCIWNDLQKDDVLIEIVEVGEREYDKHAANDWVKF